RPPRPQAHVAVFRKGAQAISVNRRHGPTLSPESAAGYPCSRAEVVPSVLALMAHPDDIEITCAGTLILLKRAGWDVHLATMTAGDLGSMRLSRAQIGRVRRREAEASSKILGASYECLGFND